LYENLTENRRERNGIWGSAELDPKFDDEFESVFPLQTKNDFEVLEQKILENQDNFHNKLVSNFISSSQYFAEKEHLIFKLILNLF
jgi:hypothetical protein